MDNKTKIFIFSPFALAIILAVAANYINIPFRKGIPESASRMAAFTPAGLTIQEKQRDYPGPDLRSALDFNQSSAVETSLPLSNPVIQKDDNDEHLSLIIISGGDKTAIINGVPVKEGDRIADMKIVKIETDRVLLKNKTLKWISLE